MGIPFLDRGCYGGPPENKNFEKPKNKSLERRIEELEKKVERMQDQITKLFNLEHDY